MIALEKRIVKEQGQLPLDLRLITRHSLISVLGQEKRAQRDMTDNQDLLTEIEWVPKSL
jgi:antitoxin component of RelBE/YafQ-DinJ toxin-antitoxin module